MRCLSQCCRTSAQSPELGYKIPRDLGTCRASVEAGASTSYKIQRHRRCRPLKQRASDAGLKMPWKTEFLIHPCIRNHQEFCGRGTYPQIRKWCRAKGMTGTPSMNCAKRKLTEKSIAESKWYPKTRKPLLECVRVSMIFWTVRSWPRHDNISAKSGYRVVASVRFGFARTCV